MEDLVIFGFEAIAWSFVFIAEFIVPILVLSLLFYAYAALQETAWAFTWESKRKKRVEASKPKPQKSAPKEAPKSSRDVVSDYADEYKLPPLPFS